MTLYEINKQILECINEDGEVLDEDRLTALSMERDEKIESVALWVKDLKAEAAAYKAEKEAFAARQKAAESKVESLTKWLSDALQGQKFKTTKCDVAFRKSKKVVIDDLWTLDEEFLKYAEPTPDKTAIKAAILEAAEKGETFKGAHIEESTSISVK